MGIRQLTKTPFEVNYKGFGLTMAQKNDAATVNFVMLL